MGATSMGKCPAAGLVQEGLVADAAVPLAQGGVPSRSPPLQRMAVICDEDCRAAGSRCAASEARRCRVTTLDARMPLNDFVQVPNTLASLYATHWWGCTDCRTHAQSWCPDPLARREMGRHTRGKVSMREQACKRSRKFAIYTVMSGPAIVGTSLLVNRHFFFVEAS